MGIPVQVFVLFSLIHLHAVSAACSQRHSPQCDRCASSCADVPLQSDFDVLKFMGVWYDIGQSRGFALSSGVSRYSQTDDGFAIRYIGARNGVCMDAINGTGKQLEGPKLHIQFHIRHIAKTGTYRIIETDYKEYALIYLCTKEWPSGLCSKPHKRVIILGRKPVLPGHVMNRLLDIAVATVGVNVDSISYSRHPGGCPINDLTDSASSESEESSGDIKHADQLDRNSEEGSGEVYSGGSGEVSEGQRAAAALEENNLSTPMKNAKPTPTVKKICRFEDVPMQENFNPADWAGEWYVLVAVRQQKSFDAAYAVLTWTDGAIRSRFTGRKNGQCLPVFESLFVPSNDTPALLNAKYLHYDGPIKVVYMDSDYVLTYQCVIPRADGSCIHTMIFLTGRRPEFPQEVKDKFHAKVRGLCKEDHLIEFESTDIGDCDKIEDPGK